MCVNRSKLLPDGGHVPEENFAELALHVGKALEFGKNASRLMRDEEAQEIWRAVYGPLAQGTPGLLGAVLGRAEAQIS